MRQQLTIEDLKYLVPGQTPSLYYSSGDGELRLEAIVTVRVNLDPEGVIVRLDTVTHAGPFGIAKVGDEIYARAEELYFGDSELMAYARRHLLDHCMAAGMSDAEMAAKLLLIRDTEWWSLFVIQFLEDLATRVSQSA